MPAIKQTLWAFAACAVTAGSAIAQEQQREFLTFDRAPAVVCSSENSAQLNIAVTQEGLDEDFRAFQDKNKNLPIKEADLPLLVMSGMTINVNPSDDDPVTDGMTSIGLAKISPREEVIAMMPAANGEVILHHIRPPRVGDLPRMPPSALMNNPEAYKEAAQEMFAAGRALMAELCKEPVEKKADPVEIDADDPDPPGQGRSIYYRTHQLGAHPSRLNREDKVLKPFLDGFDKIFKAAGVPLTPKLIPH